MGIKISEKNLVIIFLITIIMLIGMKIATLEKTTMVMMPVNKKIVVLDAGHGGFDPGKVGINGKNEKDINLDIVNKLQNFLEQGGATVYLTRATDEALANDKNGDMKERKVITNESNADLLVSIHQNAFTSSSVRGSQVFYHKNSDEGKKIATSIQNSLKDNVDSTNSRVEKENDDYYILRTTEIPTVLVECGFLSNPEEEMLLNDEVYQEKIAWGIYIGIMEYFDDF